MLIDNLLWTQQEGMENFDISIEKPNEFYQLGGMIPSGEEKWKYCQQHISGGTPSEF